MNTFEIQNIFMVTWWSIKCNSKTERNQQQQQESLPLWFDWTAEQRSEHMNIKTWNAKCNATLTLTTSWSCMLVMS